MDQFYQIYDEFQRNGLDDPDGEAWVKKLRSESGMVNWPVNVTTIGCFDTVGALGIPTLPIPGLRNIVAGVNTRKYQFLDTELNQGVLNAFHALALDERRRPFTPTLWRKKQSGEHSAVNLKQCWFPGAHTNVGGGYEDQEIADITLAWMIQQCEPWLAFDRSYLASIVSNRGDGNGPGEWVAGHIVDSWRGFHVFGGIKRRTPGGYGEGTEETIHPSVRLRMASVNGWKSRAMNGWRWEDGVWIGSNGEMLKEEKLGDWEIQLAGKELVDKVMVLLNGK